MGISEEDDGERGRLIDNNGGKHNNAGATEETLETLQDATKITDDSNKDDTSCIFHCRRNPITLISIVALALLIDKMAIAAFLLILPDYLRTMPSNVNTTTAAGYDNQSQQIGIIIALFNAVQIAGQIFAGILTHRCGHKCSFMLGVVLSFASLLVCALADRWWMLIFTSVLLGASACLTHVAGNSYVATIIEEKERRVFAFSIISYAKLLGHGLGYSLASYLYQWLGRSAPFLFMLSLVVIDGVLRIFVFVDVDPADDIKTSTTSNSNNIIVSKFLTNRWVFMLINLILTGISFITFTFCRNIWQSLAPDLLLRVAHSIFGTVYVSWLTDLCHSRFDDNYETIISLNLIIVNAGAVTGSLTPGTLIIPYVGFVVLFRAIGAVLISYSFMSLCLRNAA
ncbi:vesicular acetylcholine transporter-like [Tubulanus polymorphus]|uniref:vesicular acetylcholine transporter-like n=1 Tax=Tubulanus polymorphus TaxID=672921 RepID=UPI003DA5FD42